MRGMNIVRVIVAVALGVVAWYAGAKIDESVIALAVIVPLMGGAEWMLYLVWADARRAWAARRAPKAPIGVLQDRAAEWDVVLHAVDDEERSATRPPAPHPTVRGIRVCSSCGQPLPGAGEASTPLRVVEEDPLAAAEAGADRLERVIRYMRSAGYLPDDGGDAA